MMYTVSGKTMLAKRIPMVLPRLSREQSIQTTRIYSACGRLQPGQPLMAIRPFRSPHHTISEPGLVGGGSIPMPAEISMAHNGVLFLDELSEFNRRTFEVPAAEFKELASAKLGTSSAEIRESAECSRKAQLERFQGMSINYRMRDRDVRK